MQHSTQALLGTRDLQTFMSEGRRSCYTTVRGPNIIHNVIFSGYVTYHQSNTFLLIHYFFIVDKSGPILTLWVVVGDPCFTLIAVGEISHFFNCILIGNLSRHNP